MRPRAWCSLIRHLGSPRYRARAGFPIWWGGWLSEKGLKCGLTPSFQRETQVQACFIPPKIH